MYIIESGNFMIKIIQTVWADFDNYLSSSVQDVEEARLRVDHRSLLVRVLDRWVVVVDEVVLLLISF